MKFGVIVSALDKSRAGFASVLHGAQQLGGQIRSAITAPLRMLANPGSMALVYNVRALSSAFERLYAIEDEARIAEAKLGAIIKSTGYAAGISAQQVKAYAAARQAITTFGDDQTIDASAVMASFKNVRGGVFEEAMTAAQDLSAAMGQDLQSSVVQLGKALNDPIVGVTALQRVGVSFSESQKEMIKGLVESNRLFEAQKIILAELQSEFGGVAEAVAQGAGGQIKQIHNLIGDAWESLARIAEPFTRVLTGNIKTSLEGANTTLGEITENVRINFDKIKAVAEDAFSIVGRTMASAFGLDAGRMSATEAAIKGITRSVLAMAEAALLVKGGKETATSWWQKLRSAGALMGWAGSKALGAENLAGGFAHTAAAAGAKGHTADQELEEVRKKFKQLGEDIDKTMEKADKIKKPGHWDRIKDSLAQTIVAMRDTLTGSWTRATGSMTSALSSWAERSRSAAETSVKAAKDVGSAWAEAGNRLRSAIAGVHGGQKAWADFAMGRDEDAAQLALQRVGGQGPRANRIRFDQAGWLFKQGAMWQDRPDMAMGMLEKAWGNVQGLRQNFAQFGAGRGDWQAVDALAGQIDALQKQILGKQLEAARAEEAQAREKFNAEQRIIAAAERRAKTDGQVADGSAKLAEGFGRVLGAIDQLVKGARPQGNAGGWGGAFDALVGAIW
jgi:hypothetical protein